MSTETAATGAAAQTSYAHPEVLVDTEWVAQHLNDPNVRIVEADEDPLLYEVRATSQTPSSWTGTSMCKTPSGATS